MSNFTSIFVQYHAKWGTDVNTGTQVLQILYSSVVVLCAEEENCVNENMNRIVEYSE